MIGLVDIYKVVEAIVPLYVALILGYGSVRWWRIFTPDQGDAITRFVSYFTLPLFTFEFTAHADPFKWNFWFIAADAISKVVIVAVLALWAKCSTKGSYCWSITSFSLCTLTNSLVVGVPLLKAMYGQLGMDLVIQGSVVQAIVWLTFLLFVLEFRRSRNDIHSLSTPTGPKEEVSKEDLEGMVGVVSSTKPSFWNLLRLVGSKMAVNPNSYASIIGIVWAFASNRCHVQLPSIMDGCILIMSRAGTGTAMFSMGIFMALQEKVMSCGASLTIFGMVLRFIAGPAAMAIGAMAVGLHGDVLRVAIIQAALPQSITSFIYAKEYALHADVLSTAVIFGMLASSPVLIAYYAAMELMH
ncbi:hypothetical protein MLD38_020682 [Melastoma candidum]|uniref:Uncharacterized protein n=1 Tax=Melastoma candidum TaxID=119954 RepID=A0ACB9QDU2_9MYRT|nr:hypothetical protein MLD38_020682 [Melastoma candidum]